MWEQENALDLVNPQVICCGLRDVFVDILGCAERLPEINRISGSSAQPCITVGAVSKWMAPSHTSAGLSDLTGASIWWFSHVFFNFIDAGIPSAPPKYTVDPKDC